MTAVSRQRAFLSAGFAGLLASFAVAPAAASSPELSSVMPTGATRGTSVQLRLSGARLDDAQAVLFYKPGITVTKLAVEGPASVRVDCEIAADCELGEHPLRLRTATGVTELRTLYVGALPVVAEAEPNGDFASPQPIRLDVTVAGVIANEDVDYYAVQAVAGQRITAEIEAIRLGRAMFDPYVAILDARRFELAAADDSALLMQDGFASAVAPADGPYVVEVREASYGGGDGYHYRLHVGTFPRPSAAFPPGGPPGETLPIEYLGDVLGPRNAQIALPAGVRGILPAFCGDESGVSPSPNWLRVAPMANVVEPQTVEAAPASRPAPPSPPVAFNGCISEAGQVDVFRFTAAKGRQLDIHVYARRLRSPLDPVLDVLNSRGEVAASNDDSIGPDSYLRVGVQSEDGEFAVRVRDHRGRGGPAFVYRVEIDDVRPALSLSLERVDNRRPQFLQAVAVPRGNRFAALLRVARRDVDGPLTLDAQELPAGVTLAADTLPPGLPLLAVVFEAAADAPVDGALASLSGTIRRDADEIVGGFEQRVTLVTGPPNEAVYYETTVDRLAVAVTEAAPFRVQLAPPPSGVLRNGAAELRVIAERAEGFAGDIVVHMLWNPPGVSSAGAITIAAAHGEGVYPINAAGDAPLGAYKIAVLAHADVGGGDRWVSSQLADLPVGDVLVNGKIELAAVEQGQAGGVLCRLNPVRPFEGNATLRLVGLPAGVSAPPLEASATDTEIVFPITVESGAPLGQHGGLFCEIAAPAGESTLSHRFAMGGAIRIDPPRVAAAPAQPAQPPPQAAQPPAPAPPKPLSRLQQLRKQAAEREASVETGQGGAP